MQPDLIGYWERGTRSRNYEMGAGRQKHGSTKSLETKTKDGPRGRRRGKKVNLGRWGKLRKNLWERTSPGNR